MFYVSKKVSISDKISIYKLKLTYYNVMIKIDKQDLIDITDIKKYRIKWQKWCHKYVIHFINKSPVRKCSSVIFLMGKNYFLIEFCFEIIVLSEGNTCIA